MDKYILALDQGTTSSRAAIFNRQGRILALAKQEFPQLYPRPGWVEHNPQDIWKSQLASCRSALKIADLKPEQIAAIGITNQRETVIMWERDTGKPVYNAIVWQCRRTAEYCEKLIKDGKESLIRNKTGLLPDPYFSASKIRWLLDNVPGLQDRALKGEICFGTVDSWLLFNLTGNHLTDPSNASRTMLFNIRTGKWDRELLKLFGIPAQILPEIKPSSGLFGHTAKELLGVEIPVCSVIGDQQAALFGQCCFTPGTAKSTYGTGCFTLVNTGKNPVTSENRLLTTVAWDLGSGLEYALEGAVFVGGAVIQWLRDEMKLIKTSAESEKLARTVKNSGGVYVVPAFVGLGAPYWNPNARGSILGITRGTNPAHIARAALESIAFQCSDLISAFESDIGSRIELLRADGGAASNAFLMQFQADLLDIPLELPSVPETTALGAAYLAGLHTGYWENQEEISANWIPVERFVSRMKNAERERLTVNWHKAVNTTLSFLPE